MLLTESWSAQSTQLWRACLAGIVLLVLLLLSACAASPVATVESLRITIEVDGKQIGLQVPAGTTSQGALDQAGITLNNLDRVDPPSFTLLSPDNVIRVTRVREMFTLEENVIPFERQTAHNEALPEGKTLMVQRGVNGVEQITHRQVFEDDREVSRTVFKSEILVEPVPEILMIGVQKPFTPITLPGKLVYLSAGNAWLIETSTRERRPVVTTGDLDGRVFSLSPLGNWLLFTRAGSLSSEEGDSSETTPNDPSVPINTLWAVDLATENARPVSLNVQNIIHFAGWRPGQGLTIAYTTVEPRQAAPGWQANNELQLLTFSNSGGTIRRETIVETNAGGMYGWWGTSFAWSPDGSQLAYARPDSVGLVDFAGKQIISLVDILPYETGSDWAWIPGLGWSANGQVLYLVNHSSQFELSGLPLFPIETEDGQVESEAGPLIPLVSQVGMFAFPVPAPVSVESGPAVAYLQAIFPEQSDSQRYRLAVMDRDGSNQTILFPAENRQGLEPQQTVWSPEPMSNGHFWIAVNYQGNLWLVDSTTGEAQPVTGDGLIRRFDWK